MIKDDNKRITITFSDDDFLILDRLSSSLNVSKSNLLNLCFKNYFIATNEKINDKTTVVFNELQKNPLINIIYINNLFVVYSVGIDNNLKIIELNNIVSPIDDLKSIREELNYLLLIA